MTAERTCSVDDCEFPGHVAGKPVSASTYGNHGCRCEGCKIAMAIKGRERRDAELQRAGRDRIYRRPVIDGRKECIQCRKWVQLEFYKPIPPGGLSNQCNDCRAEQRRTEWFARRYPDGQQLSFWTGLSPEESRLVRKRRMERYRAKNVDRYRDYTRERRRRIGVPKGHGVVGVTRAQIKARWDYYGGRCWMCGAPATQTDHVKPVAKGGPNLAANMRPACGPCNGAKSDRWPFPTSTQAGGIAA